jgi:hypothetical protein
VWLVSPDVQTLEVMRLDGDSYCIVGTYGAADTVHAEPFDAVELEPAVLWISPPEAADTEREQGWTQGRLSKVKHRVTYYINTMINNSRSISFFIFFILLNLVFGCSVSPTVEKEIPKRSITLTWDSPGTNADGTALNNLAGYRIYYGPSSGVYPNKIDIADPSATKHTIYKLSPGTYYFVITAYSDSGMESEHSKEVTITIK